MSIINRLGKKFAVVQSPFLEPPVFKHDTLLFANEMSTWARTPSTLAKTNCAGGYAIWKIAQQQEHIEHLEHILLALVEEVAILKGEKVKFNCGRCGNSFFDKCDCDY